MVRFEWDVKTGKMRAVSFSPPRFEVRKMYEQEAVEVFFNGHSAFELPIDTLPEFVRLLSEHIEKVSSN